MSQNTNYLEPTLPEHWQGMERRFGQQVVDAIDGAHVAAKSNTLNQLKKLVRNMVKLEIITEEQGEELLKTL